MFRQLSVWARRSGSLVPTRRLPSSMYISLVKIEKLSSRGNNCRRGSGGQHKSMIRESWNDESDRKGLPDFGDLNRAESHETSLGPAQMKELFAGRFPADCDKDVVHLKTSYAQYRQLVNAFEKSREQRYPKRTVEVRWDANISTTSVLQGPPTQLHESVVSGITASLNIQIPDFEQFLISTSSMEYIDGVGDKVPDLMVRFSSDKSSDTSVPILVSEIGFSEKYETLKSSMDMWFNAFPTLAVGLLVKIKETPEYRSPLGRSRSSKFPNHFQNPGAALQEDIISENPEKRGSPLYLSSLQLVGQTKAYMEVWVRDSDTGQPIIQGNRIEFYGYEKPAENFTMKFNRFVPSNDPIYDRTLTFDWAMFQPKIDKHRRLLAEYRLKKIINAYRKREGDTKGEGMEMDNAGKVRDQNAKEDEGSSRPKG